jgi:hypothetical protein
MEIKTMIQAQKVKLPERKPENAPTRMQLNRHFESEKEMIEFVKREHPTATIKQFWPSQVLNCVIEIPCKKK